MSLKYRKLENVTVQQGMCPFASYEPTGELSLLYHVKDMDLNQELNQSVMDVQTDNSNTICHIHIRGRDKKILIAQK